MPFLINMLLKFGNKARNSLFKLRIQKTLQCRHIKKMTPLLSTKRASFLASMQKASLTVEAAVVVPVFLFACLQLSSVFVMYQNQIDAEAKLHQSARALAVGAYLTGLPGDQCIDLYAVRTEKPAVRLLPVPGILTSARCVVRGFTGYDTSQYLGKNENEEIVFVTPSGSVYHKRVDCTYLDIKVSCVRKNEIMKQRNKDGEKYYPCEACGKGTLDLYYISEYGNRYHSNISCKKLKRTVLAVPLSEASGRHACSKCGGL